MAEANVKGTILAARLSFVRARGGEPLLDRVLGRLSTADQKALRGCLLVTSSYPLALNARLDEAIAVELSPGNPDAVFLEMGRSSADVNLRGPQKLFVQQGDPHHLLGFSEQIYGYYYATGRRTSEKTGPNSAVVITEGGEGVTPHDCLSVIGWYQRAIELSGGSDVEVAHPVCAARGGPRCEYHCKWQ